MKDWVPLLVELVWPIFLITVLFLGRSRIFRLIKALEDRIVSGAEVEAAGIRVGTAPKLTEVTSHPVSPLIVTGGSEKGGSDEEPGQLKPSPLYLVHTARREPSLDRGELQYYRLRVYVDADEPQVLNEIAEVTYYLHETFKEPVRTVSDRRTGFELQTIAWGEFNVAVLVQFKNGSTQILQRYLNL